MRDVTMLRPLVFSVLSSSDGLRQERERAPKVRAKRKDLAPVHRGDFGVHWSSQWRRVKAGVDVYI